MEVKPLPERVSEGFASQEDRAFGEKYFELLLAAWRETGSALRRTAFLIAALVVAFFLLIGTKKAELSFGPLKLTDVKSTLAIVPAVVSFLYYEFVALEVRAEFYEEISNTLLAKLHPNLAKSGLGVALTPPSSSISTDNPWATIRVVPRGRAYRVVSGSGVVVILAIVIGAVGFLVFAYWQLFREPDVNVIAVVISVCFAAFNVVRGVAEFVDGFANIQGLSDP